ncbi:hypothetical protein [Brucella intermedia]|uniref:hypothetical protein n=1 Tax=Brucella intermedia TaxID=94625 RepID=UPI0034CD99A5
MRLFDSPATSSRISFHKASRSIERRSLRQSQYFALMTLFQLTRFRAEISISQLVHRRVFDKPNSQVRDDLLNLAGKAIPPCVNPLKGMFEYSEETGTRNPGSPHSNQMTPYNRELYVLATLCPRVLKLEHKPGLPVDDCLAEVVKQKGTNLPDFWAKSLNNTLAKLSASVDIINERLMMLDKDAKTYSFPEMRKRLTDRYEYLPEMIFV